MWMGCVLQSIKFESVVRVLGQWELLEGMSALTDEVVAW